MCQKDSTGCQVAVSGLWRLAEGCSMKTILVAVDLSDLTMKMVKVAVHLARPFQSKIILVHAVEHAPQLAPIGIEPIPVTPVEDSAPDFTEELSRLQKMISHVGLESTKLELQGPPVESILTQAESLRADLIILGSHNRGVLHHLLAGSVVDGILQRSKCPVLIVPLHD
jgi:nucleotide-binding universal stress UspA family protein